MVFEQIRALVIGLDETRTSRTLGVACTLYLAVYVWFGLGLGWERLPVAQDTAVAALTAVLTAGVAWHTHRNLGLLAGLSLPVAPAVALAIATPERLTASGVVDQTREALLWGVEIGIPIGVAGIAIGVVVRLLSHYGIRRDRSTA
ncbi:hypothetical protein ACNS7O_09160 [Haloferacaceae archaeon DSL9]